MLNYANFDKSFVVALWSGVVTHYLRVFEMEDKASPAPPGLDPAGETEVHPLENPVVLERLFELIPFKLKEFRSFRLVSRAWNQSSLSTWRANACLALRDSKSAAKKKEDDGDSDDYEDIDWDEDEDVDLDDDEDIELDNDDKKDVDLKDDEDVVNSDDDEKTKWITRQKYLQLLENDQYQLAQHPFRKYSLFGVGIDLKSTNADGEQDQVRFWNKVGPLMSHLDLKFCIFAGVTDFRTVVFEATSNLQSLSLIWNTYTDQRPATWKQRKNLKLARHAMIPPEKVQNNLVELNIELLSLDGETDTDEGEDDDEGESWVEYLPVTWIELFIHFPNIKKLGRLQSAVDQIDVELFEFFISLEILRRKHGPRFLADLSDLDMYFPGGLICHINGLQFPLQRLTVCIQADLDEGTFMQLVQYPLEYLNVDRSSLATRPFPNFPFGFQFHALKELIFTGGPIAPNLMFLKECPNLELLRYTPFSENWLAADLTQFLSDGNNPTKLLKLKDLSIISDGCSAAEIKLLRVIMPNVRNLEVGLDDGSFRAICDVWKELEHLSIVPFRVGEEALLGMGERDGEKFRYPNLTDLKTLKKFEMEDIKSERDRQGLTDVVILDGILALPNLEVVDLCLSSKVTPEALTQLEMKFSKCHISTQEAAAEVNDKSE